MMRRSQLRRRRRRDSGILLAVVILLLGVVLATAAVAVWGLRGDTGSAGRDRNARQLFDCAEQGLAFGKQYFSTTGRAGWNVYFSTNVCGTNVLPCPPFPTTAPTAPTAGGYPTGAPFTHAITMGTAPAPITSMTVTVGIYNNPGDPGGLFSDTDESAVIVARCVDNDSGQVRVLQTVLGAKTITTDDYLGQAGRGMRNQGNANNQ